MSQQSPRDSVVDGCSESTQPDYESVEIPSKPPTEYTWQQRRTELLQLIRQAGHPRALNQTELADRYGVTQQQISKDFDRLAEHTKNALGTRRALISDAVFNRSIEGLLEEGEYRKAAQTVKDWNEWVDEYRELQALEQRIEQHEAKERRRKER